MDADRFEQLLRTAEAMSGGWLTHENLRVPCGVIADGKMLKHVLGVHRKTGRVRVARQPIQTDKHRKRVLSDTVRARSLVIVPLTRNV